MRLYSVKLHSILNYISQSVFVSLLLILSTPFLPKFQIIEAESRVFAQAPSATIEQAEKLFVHGYQQLQNNQPEAALQSWKQALSIYQQLKDRKGESLVLGGIGSIYISLGDYPQAIAYYQKKLVIARELKDRESEGTALTDIGVIYYYLGDYHQAINYLEQSLQIARGLKNRPSEGLKLLNLGLAYFYLGDLSTSMEHSQAAIAIAREVKDRNLEGSALGNLGLAYFVLGEDIKALEIQKQSWEIARELKNLQAEGNALGNIGNIFLRLGKYQEAIEFHQKWLAIARKIKDIKSEGNALANLGLVYHEMGEYSQAINFQQQRLDIARRIKDHQGESISLFNIGNIYSTLGDYAKAVNYQQQSLQIAREVKDIHTEGNVLNNLGLNLYKQGKLNDAENTLMAAVQTWENIRAKGLKDVEKVSIFETQRGSYNTLQQVLIAQNKTDKALEISERGRGRAFVELLNSRIKSNSNTQAPTPPNINQIKQIAKQQNTTLVQYSIIYEQFPSQENQTTNQPSKQPRTQSVKESELYIWVIKPTGEISFRKTDLKPLWQKQNTSLKELVKTTRSSITAVRGGINVSENPNAPKRTDNLQQLHQLLINPIADLLPKNPDQKVTFIPQDSLFLVPFPALQDQNKKYLIEKYTILTSPSIHVLELTRKQKQRISQTNSKRRGDEQFLIVGNPTMPQYSKKIGEPPQQLTPLPGAEKEARAIANFFQTQFLTGNQASEAEVTKRLSKARLIHLATHGLFDEFRGLNSSVALAKSNKNNSNNPNDGFLTAEEILDLQLNAELVVLSACDTGRGEISGDGVIGLSRSFIGAGVPSVLVSLWAVPDAPTAELMQEFYQKTRKYTDKAQALRQAMLTTMKQHPEVENWAAFTLIGEAE